MTRLGVTCAMLLAGAGAVGACSLNPQPLPPGDTSDASAQPTTGGSGSSGGGQSNSDSDASGRFDGSDGSIAVDGAPWLGPTDGSSDAPTNETLDASSDAMTDAPPDDAPTGD